MQIRFIIIMIVVSLFVLPVHGQKAEMPIAVAAPVVFPASAVPPAVPAVAAKKEFIPISDIDISHLKDPAQFFWGIDPFSKQPGFVKVDHEKESPLDKLKLEAIIFEPKDPVAIINGVLVKQGDTIEDFVVEVIAANYIVVRGERIRAEVSFYVAKEVVSDIEQAIANAKKESKK